MTLIKKEVFTKFDVLNALYKTTDSLNIDKKTVNVLLRWNDKFLNKDFWKSEPNSFYGLVYIPVLYLDIKNVRSGGIEITYNPYTDTMLLTCMVNDLDENNIFGTLPTDYKRTINLHNSQLEEVWETRISIDKKEARLITLKKIDTIITQATSVLTMLNDYRNCNISILDKDLTFNFDTDKSHYLLINKLKITYYMERHPNLFKEVTSNVPIQDILNENEQSIKDYIKLLEMSTI